jgi:hypothetical protein
MMKLRDHEQLYIRSMGKALQVIAIFDNDAEANAFMKGNSGAAVVANFGKYVFIASKWDKGDSNG